MDGRPEPITRRGLLTGVCALALTGTLAPRRSGARSAVRDLMWGDLVPEDGGIDMDALRALGTVQHGQLTTPFDQELGGKLTSEYDGETVRIPGYLVPLDFEGMAVTSALLVPYVGACIHVPPPPPNQLIFVTASEPYEYDGLFEAVHVTGTFGSAATETMFAEVGYAIDDALIEPYR